MGGAQLVSALQALQLPKQTHGGEPDEDQRFPAEFGLFNGWTSELDGKTRKGKGQKGRENERKGKTRKEQEIGKKRKEEERRGKRRKEEERRGAKRNNEEERRGKERK